jgi:hypothetical protein
LQRILNKKFFTGSFGDAQDKVQNGNGSHCTTMDSEVARRASLHRDEVQQTGGQGTRSSLVIGHW